VAQQFQSVSSSAAQLVAGGAQYGNETITIMNPPTSGVTAYLGAGSGVGTTTGFPLTPGSTITWYNPPSAGCYGITASGLVTLTVTQVIS
jgi:hypothetical protein